MAQFLAVRLTPIMDITEAQKIVSRERAAWLFVSAKLTDDELLRRRERWHNGLAMFFVFALLVGYFVLPTLWSHIGEQVAIYGTWGTLVGFIFAARQHSTLGNRCRDVREFLRSQT